MGKCTCKVGTCGGKEGGVRNASINCGVSKNVFFIMAKLDMAKKFHGIWESALVKWKLVGGKKEVEGLAVAIVEFLKLNSSITAKLDMAKENSSEMGKYNCKMGTCGEKKKVEGMAVSILEFLKMSSSITYGKT